MIANNFNDFVEKVSEAERKVLNSEIGQKITQKYLSECLKENPEMTAEEWKEKKAGLLTYLFCLFCLENAEAKKELAEHTYNEIIKSEV